MRHAITYLRFSSAIQGAEGADSTRRQNDLFKQWLKKNSDAQVVASFSDEGLSGYKGKHLTGQFGDMLARIEAGEFAYFHERRSLNNFHRDRVITFEQIAE